MPRLTKRDKNGNAVITGVTEENKEELTVNVIERLTVYEETLLLLPKKKFIERG